MVPEQPLPIRTPEIICRAKPDLAQRPRRRAQTRVLGSGTTARVHVHIFGDASRRQPAHVRPDPKQLQRAWAMLDKPVLERLAPRVVEDVQIPQRSELCDLYI